MHLDLNLLVALDALLEEGSVLGAAQRLHLSPPAVSRTLGRIRRATGDEILVRTGRTMTPTPFAIHVAPQVRLLVQQAESVLSPRRTLDLSSLERTFTLRCHDALTSAIAPAVLAAVAAEAPGVTVRFVTEEPTDTLDLRHGRVDLELGATQPKLPEIRHEVMAEGRLVVAGARDNTVLADELTTEAYASCDHLIVSRRGRLHDPVDSALAELGLRRRVVAALPTVASALLVVARSCTVVAVTEGGCQDLIDALGLIVAPLPVEVPPLQVICAWHQRHHTDPAHAWLRDLVRRALHGARSRAAATPPG